MLSDRSSGIWRSENYTLKERELGGTLKRTETANNLLLRGMLPGTNQGSAQKAIAGANQRKKKGVFRQTGTQRFKRGL